MNGRLLNVDNDVFECKEVAFSNQQLPFASNYPCRIFAPRQNKAKVKCWPQINFLWLAFGNYWITAQSFYKWQIHQT